MTAPVEIRDPPPATGPSRCCSATSPVRPSRVVRMGRWSRWGRVCPVAGPAGRGRVGARPA